MMKSLFLTAIMLSALTAVEFRVGKGSYDTDISIKEFMNHDTANDITTFSLHEAHKAFLENPLFYYYDAEVYTSSSKSQETEFANFATNYEFPLVGSVNQLTNSFLGMFPVEGDYKALGFDMNFGLGYDVLRKGESYLGLALNLGATLPLINAENLTSKVSFAYDLIESWDLDITTYKIGPAIKGNLAINPEFSLYGSFSLGFQKGAVESKLFKSSLDVNGDYSALDIGVRYQEKASQYFFLLGHTTKRWSVDSAEVNLYNFFNVDVFAPFTTELKSNYTYLGVGYRF